MPSFFHRPTPLSKRGFLKALGLASLKISSSGLHAQLSKESHQIDPNWPSLKSPLYPVRCQISGVAVASDGKILALNRGENSWDPKAGFRKQRIQRPAILVIDPDSGAILKAWGENTFVMPHQISVDRHGQFWISDVGQNAIFAFTPDGEKLLEISGKEIGFNMPTDMASLSDGSFIVSDGYGNARILHFSATGKKLADWGTRGSNPLQFRTPHSVTVDESDRIYIADRENHRIQVLDPQGHVLNIWTKVDRPLTVRFSAGFLYVLSNLEAEKGIVRKLTPAGDLVSAFHSKPSPTEDDFEWPHGLAIDPRTETIYVGFTLTSRQIRRYTRIS